MYLIENELGLIKENCFNSLQGAMKTIEQQYYLDVQNPNCEGIWKNEGEYINFYLYYLNGAKIIKERIKKIPFLQVNNT